MIVWSGWGFLTVLFAVSGAVLGNALKPVLDRSFVHLPGSTGLAVGLLAAACVNWLVGMRLNRAPGRDIIDAKAGQRLVFRRPNSLFWIPMQYVSVLMLIAAVLAVLGVLDAPSGQPG